MKVMSLVQGHNQLSVFGLEKLQPVFVWVARWRESHGNKRLTRDRATGRALFHAMCQATCCATESSEQPMRPHLGPHEWQSSA